MLRARSSTDGSTNIIVVEVTAVIADLINKKVKEENAKLKVKNAELRAENAELRRQLNEQKAHGPSSCPLRSQPG